MAATEPNPTSLAARAEQVELGVYSRYAFVPVRGEGCYLYDTTGKRYLDLYGGHAVSSTGHSHPHVVSAIKQQAEQLLFYSNTVHCEARVIASEMLLKHAPHADSRVFYCCSGSEANETAMKIARKITGRRKIVSFVQSFHGRTVATLSASGIEKYRATAGPVTINDHVYVPFGDAEALHDAVDKDTAAVMCEAIQSLGGVYMAEPRFYYLMGEVARNVGAAFIMDEVQTAFGRTGSFFFSGGVAVKPDIITTAKGIASGLPVGAAIIAPAFAREIGVGDHGSTFGGGPVPMAAMRATLEVIERENLAENAGKVGHQIMEGVRDLPGVRDVRGKGLLIGIEFDGPCKPIQQSLLRMGYLTGSSAHPHVMRLLPPLVLRSEQAAEFIKALDEALHTHAWSD